MRRPYLKSVALYRFVSGIYGLVPPTRVNAESIDSRTMMRQDGQLFGNVAHKSVYDELSTWRIECYVYDFVPGIELSKSWFALEELDCNNDAPCVNAGEDDCSA